MMMLEQFTVENFKAFKSLTLDDLGHINIFVGDNNVGKTCLLQAISLFLSVEETKNTELAKLKTLSGFKEVEPIVAINLSEILETDLIDNFYLQKISDDISLQATIKKEQTNYTLKLQHIFRKTENDLLDSDVLTIQGDNITKNVFFLAGEKENFDDLKNKLPKLTNTFCYLPTATNFRVLATINYNAFIRKKELKTNIISLLNIIEPNLEDIVYGSNKNLLVALTNREELQPINLMGDGFAKLMGLATCFRREDTTPYCLIDEPENGFHYKTQTSFWKLLANWSLEGDKQSFIATHSYELISCLNDLLTADESLLKRGLKVRVHRLKRDKNDPEKINVVTLDEQSIVNLLERGGEMR